MVISIWILILRIYLFFCIFLVILIVIGNYKVLGRILRWFLKVLFLVCVLCIIFLSVDRIYEYKEVLFLLLLGYMVKGKIFKVSLI